MENVKTKVRLIIEGNIAFVNADSHSIEIEIDSTPTDLWTEQILIDANIVKDNCVEYIGEGVIRVKKNGKLELKKM